MPKCLLNISYNFIGSLLSNYIAIFLCQMWGHKQARATNVLSVEEIVLVMEN